MTVANSVGNRSCGGQCHSTQTLVSAQAGSPLAGAGGASEPVIDDDGHLVSYVSTAGDLIPGQSGPAGVKNVFVWLRQTGANILASGQDGSPTVTANADADFPLLTRHSFPGFSSRATNLQRGVGGTSVAYINTLVALSLSPNAVADGSAAGSVVGTLSVSSLLAGQYLPPVYTLPPGIDDNAAFALRAASGGTAPLVIEVPASYAGQSSYQVLVHVDIGFGDDSSLLRVAVIPPNPAGGGGHVASASGGVTARLIPVKVGKRKTLLLLLVFSADTGTLEGAFDAPFQRAGFKNLQVSVLGGNRVVVTARKGKRTVTATYPA
jgi:hypothetical protein